MKTYIIDSFTDQPFKGNPAGVCLPDRDLSEREMLLVAKELGLSETAFIRPLADKDSWSIRYFSPKVEIPLCGHATLASAHALFSVSDIEQVNFTNIQGILLSVSKRGKEIEMQFPLYQTEPAKAPGAMLEALGLKEINNVVYNKETNILLLEISSAQTLAELSPDFQALVHSHAPINGVLVTAPGEDGEFDFHSRLFWPWFGTNEDPVTGATHTFLAPYWTERLGKKKLRSFQASERTGFMSLEIINDHQLLITGQAITVLEGTIHL